MNTRVAVYVRVSTSEQSTELQLREIKLYLASKGVSRLQVFEDKATGTNGKRPQLTAMMTDIRAGKFDMVVCWKLDRLFRSLKGLIDTLAEFKDLNVDFIAVKNHMDLTTPAGRMLMQILGAVGEFEASLIRERVKAGLANAKAKGVKLGAAPRFDIAEAFALRAQGLTFTEIGTRLQVSRQAVHRALKLCK